MKSTLSFISLATCALISTAGLSPAAAQNVQTPGIDRAQQDISVRIQQGIASGHLTPPEAQGLLRRHQEMQFRENQFKAKGWASAQERQDLRTDLNSLGLEVERLMTNNDVVRPQGQGMGAGLHTPGIDRAQQDISARIQQGMASGHITPWEAQQLMRRERDIQMRENASKSNGDVNNQERQQLRSELAALSSEVERMMTNNEVVQRSAGGQRNHQGSNLSARIEEGARSGRLNRHETRRLHERERELERNRARDEADGVVTRQEAVRQENDLQALLNDVEKMMRNRR